MMMMVPQKSMVYYTGGMPYILHAPPAVVRELVYVAFSGHQATFISSVVVLDCEFVLLSSHFVHSSVANWFFFFGAIVSYLGYLFFVFRLYLCPPPPLPPGALQVFLVVHIRCSQPEYPSSFILRRRCHACSTFCVIGAFCLVSKYEVNSKVHKSPTPPPLPSPPNA